MKVPGSASTYFFLAALILSFPIFGQFFYKGYSGKFLVATQHVKGDIFTQSVIYIPHHNLFDAYGLIINKPSEVDDVYVGGPVTPDRFYTLYLAQSGLVKSNKHIDPEMTRAQIQHLHKKHISYKIYKGYSGWGFLQLEREVKRGSWRVIDAPNRIIFDHQEEDTLWSSLIQIKH